MMDTQDYKSQLLSLRNDLTHRINAIAKDLHHEEIEVEKDFAEQATQLENSDVLNSLDVEAKSTVMKINSALIRIKEGSFGFCEKCGAEINEQRLKVVPFANLCIKCAEE